MKQRTRQWLNMKGKSAERHLVMGDDGWEPGTTGGTDPGNRAAKRPAFRFAMAQYVRGSGIKRRRRKLGKNGFNPRRMSSKL